MLLFFRMCSTREFLFNSKSLIATNGKMFSARRTAVKLLNTVMDHNALYQKVPSGTMEYWESSKTTWRRQSARVRSIILLFTSCTLLLILYQGMGIMAPPGYQLQDDLILSSNVTTRLPHIPPKVWQIYFTDKPDSISGYKNNMFSWISRSPSYSYTVVDQPGALSIISKLSVSTHPHILPVFYSMSRRVLRVDFVRYIILALNGGVYSDMDTELLQPVYDWVPSEYRTRTKLIVGIEADQDPPVEGTTYQVQFGQWTLASAPSHPALWMMIERILDEVQKRPYHDPPHNIEYSNGDVLNITGPAGWTQTIMRYLSHTMGEELTWRNFTGMTEPRLFADVLVLPINGFASHVPHSGASPGGSDAFVRHQQQGSWKGSS